MNAKLVAVLLAQGGKVLGPRAAKAVRASAPLLMDKLQKDWQSGKLLEQAAGLRRGGAGRIAAQIELATATVTEELQEQTPAERQAQCRAWLRALKVERLALEATKNQARKVAKARRIQVAESTDAILAEIIETIGKWGEAT